MIKWKVLDREILSDHYYILFETTAGPPNIKIRRNRKIDAKKLEALLKSNHLSRTLYRYIEAYQRALALLEAINKCRPPIQSGGKAGKSVHWWSPEINALRINANHLRRAFQRKRKKHGQAGSTEEEANAKAAKRKFAHAIKRAKESAWRNLCDLVQKDTWRLPSNS